MIKPRSTEAIFDCLDLMLDAVIKPHHSHESRNAQLSVIRALIDDWKRSFNQYTSDEDRKSQAPETLDAVYYLCIWQLDGETHSCVRQRLYLARSVLLQYRRRCEEIREEKRASYRSETMTLSKKIEVAEALRLEESEVQQILAEFESEEPF